MITINGEPFSVYLKVENEILHLRDVKREQADEIKRLKELIVLCREDVSSRLQYHIDEALEGGVE